MCLFALLCEFQVHGQQNNWLGSETVDLILKIGKKWVFSSTFLGSMII